MAKQAEQAKAIPQAAAEAVVGLPGRRLLGAVPVEPGPAAVSAGSHSCENRSTVNNLKP